MQVAALGQRHQLLHHRPQLLGLGQGGDDLLVLDQAGGHVGEHGGTVGVINPLQSRRTNRGAGGPHAVLKLQQLGRELDVGKRTAAQLEVELRILASGDALALDACLHASHLAHVIVCQCTPHVGLNDLHEPTADIGVTGHRTGA